MFRIIEETVLKSDDDVPLDDLSEAIGILVDVMDKFGDAPWLLFVRLETIIEERESREARKAKYRRVKDPNRKPAKRQKSQAEKCRYYEITKHWK